MTIWIYNKQGEDRQCPMTPEYSLHDFSLKLKEKLRVHYEFGESPITSFDCILNTCMMSAIYFTKDR